MENKWFTPEIKSLMNRRDFLKKKYNNSKLNGINDIRLFNKYKSCRNSVVKVIRISRKKYFSELITNSKENNVNIWKVISKVIPTKNSIKHNNNNISNVINVENLNKHFTTAVSMKVNEVLDNNSDYNSINIDLLSPNTFTLHTTPVVTNKMVENKVKKLSNKKAIGSDSISVRFCI